MANFSYATTKFSVHIEAMACKVVPNTALWCILTKIMSGDNLLKYCLTMQRYIDKKQKLKFSEITQPVLYKAL